MERLDTGLIAAQFRRSTSHRSRDARAAAVVEQLLSENSQADTVNLNESTGFSRNQLH